MLCSDAQVTMIHYILFCIHLILTSSSFYFFLYSEGTESKDLFSDIESKESKDLFNDIESMFSSLADDLDSMMTWFSSWCNNVCATVELWTLHAEYRDIFKIECMNAQQCYLCFLTVELQVQCCSTDLNIARGYLWCVRWKVSTGIDISSDDNMFFEN